MSDFSWIEKIKVNNALVIFLMIVTCSIFPTIIWYCTSSQNYVYSEILQGAILATLFGCSQFCTFYIIIFFLSLFALFKIDNPKVNHEVNNAESEKPTSEPKDKNFDILFRLPLFAAMAVLLITYGFISILCVFLSFIFNNFNYLNFVKGIILVVNIYVFVMVFVVTKIFVKNSSLARPSSE